MVRGGRQELRNEIIQRRRTPGLWGYVYPAPPARFEPSSAFEIAIGSVDGIRVQGVLAGHRTNAGEPQAGGQVSAQHSQTDLHNQLIPQTCGGIS